MLSDKVQEALVKIPGWCNQEKALQFAQHLASDSPKLCLEIGVFGGRSLVVLGLLLKEISLGLVGGGGLVIGLDSWGKDDIKEGNEEKDMDWYLAKDLEPIYQACLKYIQTYEISSHCSVLRLSSTVAAPLFGDSTLDLLHIDGNHSEKVSFRDTSLYLPKVKHGGIVVFDDINWETTRKAQDLLETSCSIVYKSSHFGVYKRN